MAKQPSKNANLTINSVALEDDITSFTLDVRQELAKTDCFANTGPTRVVGNYDHSLAMEFVLDFAASQSDATIFALLASAGVATGTDPTGASAGASDPNYDCTSMVLESYSIKGAVGAAVTGSATLQGNAALSRAVA